MLKHQYCINCGGEMLVEISEIQQYVCDPCIEKNKRDKAERKKVLDYSKHTFEQLIAELKERAVKDYKTNHNILFPIGQATNWEKMHEIENELYRRVKK